MSISPNSTIWRKNLIIHELKDVEFKIGQLLFIPGEQKNLPSELILFWMNKNFYPQDKFYSGWTKKFIIQGPNYNRCRIKNRASYFLFWMNKKMLPSELILFWMNKNNFTIRTIILFRMNKKLTIRTKSI